MTKSFWWGNSPVANHTGTIADIRRHIPSFERRPFAISDGGHRHFRENLRLDTVVRLPHDSDPDYIPVGVVSKDYALLPHTDVFDLAVQALEYARIDPAEVRAVRGPYKNCKPTTVSVRSANVVAGSPEAASNLFDVSQILAWLAKERRDLQEQVEWREQIRL